nr:hypothetical protein [Actinosynnema sp. ALI-1.44]
MGVAAGGVQAFDLLRVATAVGDGVVERAEQHRQRRAELVADVGQERRLGPVAGCAAQS